MPAPVTSIDLVIVPVLMLMPCFLNAFSTVLETSASSIGITRSTISTTVHSVPNAL